MRFPAWDFTDRSVHVEEVFGARGRSLMTRLNESRSSIQAFGILAAFLGGELAGPEYGVPLSQGRCNRVQVGMEASGHARWFERIMAELNIELWIGDAAEIGSQRVRKQKTDREDLG